MYNNHSNSHNFSEYLYSILSEHPPHSLSFSKNDETNEVPVSPQVVQNIDKTRCFQCNKKLKLTNQFDCKCLAFFCKEHKYPNTHKCSYDYKTEVREKLKLNNPTVAGNKLTKC
jgi:hypothetical protein